MMEPNNSVEIPNKRYFTIGEVSKITKIKTHILRYWEKSFKEYFTVERVSNRRMFQKKDLITFLKIKELTNKGLNIKAIKKVLDQGDFSLNLDIEVVESLKEILKILKT